MAPIIAKYARSIHLNENPAALLSQWTIVETSLRRRNAKPTDVARASMATHRTTGRFIILRDQRMCIAADDPRLKEYSAWRPRINLT
jgi:hypothetical protein